MNPCLFHKECQLWYLGLYFLWCGLEPTRNRTVTIKWFCICHRKSLDNHNLDQIRTKNLLEKDHMGHQQSPEPAAFLNSLVYYKIYLSVTKEKKIKQCYVPHMKMHTFVLLLPFLCQKLTNQILSYHGCVNINQWCCGTNKDIVAKEVI